MAGAGNDQPRVIPVKAILRGRPLIEREIAEGCEKCLEFIPESNQVVLGGSKSFTFDHVFDANIGQEEVYNTAVRPLTEGIFKGYHATVLAYGQTGSGKTYSMGSAHNSTSYQNESTGIIPRVIADIFSGIDERPEREFTVKVSYLELYKRDLFDLLCPPSERRPITIRDDPDGGTQITGLAELVVSNTEETLKVMDKGNSRRTTAATAMNLVSSRSHAIFTVLLESTGKEDPNDKIISKFHLVDLAGSERAKRTKAEGERLQEGIKINEGLLALGNVISALADENLRSGHIKYRDSKLTRILQGSLGGNSHTLMIACVSPADSNHEETLNTLRYADRVRKIKNKPVVNRDPQAALIVSLKQEIQALNLRLLEKGDDDFQPSSSNLHSGSNTDRNTTDKFKKTEKEISNLKVDKENLMEQLQDSVDQHADMCEKAILAEMDRDRLQEQLGGVITSAKSILTEFPDLIVVGQDIEHQPAKDRYLKLAALQKLVLEINVSESAAGLDDCPNEEPDKENHSPNFNDDEGGTDQSISAAYTRKNADLGKQMQELSKALSLKEALAKKMTSNDSQITTLRVQYESKLQQLDKDIQNLAKEKANLELALEQAQKTKESRKLSEKRRQRVADLENQIQELKKERKEKEKLIRMKSESDRSIHQLNREIQEMKRNRIILMKQIKDENGKFNLWKKEKTKEVKQLQEKNRKRNFEYVKLERTYDKQKATLRRKTEEAAAAHRRLKEAMNKRQATSASRRASEKRTMDGAGPRIRAWLDEEIEILTSMKEAEHHLNLLLEDRKVIARELQNSAESPRKRRRTFDSADFQNRQKEHEELRQEMKLKNAQIQEMQNKLADAKDNHTGNNRWTHIGTLLDAKCALKYLLQLIVAANIEDAKQKEAIEEGVKAREAAEEIARSLKIKMHEMERKHREEQTLLGHSHQDEISVLVTRFGSFSDDISVASPEVLERVVTKQAVVIGTLKEERKDLLRQLLEQRTSLTPLRSGNHSFFKPLQAPDFDDKVWEDEKNEDGGSENEPVLQKRRKRMSDLGCKCSKSKFLCKGDLCGCVQKGNRCGEDCKCSGGMCYNPVLQGEESHHDTFITGYGNATFNADISDEAGPSKASTPTFPAMFPKVDNFDPDKENFHPDIIPRTPMDAKDTAAPYKPVHIIPKLDNFDTDKENLHPDIIPCTPMGAEDKPGPYKPVYFSSPLPDQK